MADAFKIQLIGFKAFQSRLLKIADKSKVTRDFHRELTRIWKDATEAFIRAAVRQVLVETGMTAASFLPLARAIKRFGLDSVILEHASNPTSRNPRFNRSKHATFPSGNRIPPGPSQTLGQTLGEKGYVFDTGTPAKLVLRFNFKTTVFQHVLHEGAQKSLISGRDAFQESINSSIRPALIGALKRWFNPPREGTTARTEFI